MRLLYGSNHGGEYSGVSINICNQGFGYSGSLPKDPFKGSTVGSYWTDLIERSAATSYSPQDALTVRIQSRGWVQWGVTEPMWLRGVLPLPFPPEMRLLYGSNNGGKDSCVLINICNQGFGYNEALQYRSNQGGEYSGVLLNRSNSGESSSDPIMGFVQTTRIFSSNHRGSTVRLSKEIQSRGLFCPMTFNISILLYHLDRNACRHWTKRGIQSTFSAPNVELNSEKKSFMKRTKKYFASKTYIANCTLMWGMICASRNLLSYFWLSHLNHLC